MVEPSIDLPDGAEVARLRHRFHGQLLLPDQDGYHTAWQVWNAMVDRRPAVIARCASPADVAAAVRLGRTLGLELGVRGGGHSVLGLSVPEGGLMIDLTPMGSVRVDPDRRRAWVVGGALLGDLDRATQPYGLATTAGNVSHTGWAASPWAAGWAGWRGSSGWPATTSPASSWWAPTASCCRPVNGSTRTCSGGCAAAGGTSGWSPSSSSPSTRWARRRWWSSCSTHPRTRRGHCAAGAS
jgi:FAD/FMN-containing dehydrogenase